jgi:hypothetical protein
VSVSLPVSLSLSLSLSEGLGPRPKYYGSQKDYRNIIIPHHGSLIIIIVNYRVFIKDYLGTVDRVKESIIVSYE